MPPSTLLEKGYVTIPFHTLSLPSLITGQAGSGKTETILKNASIGASTYNMNIILMDAKGDDELAARFVAVMRKAGKQHIKLFPTSSYYGWTGDPRALYNRMMAVQSYSEPYYEGIAQMMLDLALNTPYTPRSSAELLKNLTLEQLRICYRGLPEQSELDRIKPDDANGVYNRYRAFFRALHGKLDSGFTFDECDASYIKLDTVAFAKEASSIGRYLVEDLAHYITVRKEKGKKVLIIIDEVSALAIENIANLSERLRSFGGAMMLACQSEEGLAKTQDERNRILKTSHMLILHTSNAPEKLVERAGKHKTVNAGWSIQGEEGTGFGTVRMQEEYIIPPDEARRLNVGEAFVIAQGYGYKVHVAPVQIDPTSLADAQTYIEQEARANDDVEATTPADADKLTQSGTTQENDQPQTETTQPDLL